MKPIYISIMVAFGFGLAQAQEASPCSVPDSVAKVYRNDADQMALLRTFQDSTTWIDSATINPALSDSLLEALLAVYAADHLPARDTVVEKINIHHWQEIPLRQLYMYADTGYAWLYQFLKDSTETGLAGMDSLMQRYQFRLSRVWSYSKASNALPMELTAGDNYNLEAIAELFESFPGVVYALPSYDFGDGDYINYSLNNDYVEITYSHGWWMCIGGCNYRRDWKFRVYDRCSVEYVGSYGDALPADVSLGEKQLREISVSPNPFGGYLQVTGAPKKAGYALYNSLGQKVQEGKIKNERINIDAYFPRGTYVLVVTGLEGERTASYKLLR